MQQFYVNDNRKNFKKLLATATFKCTFLRFAGLRQLNFIPSLQEMLTTNSIFLLREKRNCLHKLLCYIILRSLKLSTFLEARGASL